MNKQFACPVALAIERESKRHLHGQVIPFRRKGETRFVRRIALGCIAAGLVFAAVLVF